MVWCRWFLRLICSLPKQYRENSTKYDYPTIIWCRLFRWAAAAAAAVVVVWFFVLLLLFYHIYRISEWMTKPFVVFPMWTHRKKTNTEELWPHEQKKIDIIFYPWWHGWIELRWTFVLFPNINMYINWTHNDNFAWTLDIRHHTLDYVQCKRNIGSYIHTLYGQCNAKTKYT